MYIHVHIHLPILHGIHSAAVLWERLIAALSTPATAFVLGGGKCQSVINRVVLEPVSHDTINLILILSISWEWKAKASEYYTKTVTGL